MPNPPSSIPDSRRSFWIALAVCLLVALAAARVLKSLDDPWTGSMGRLLFGKEAGSLGTFEKYHRVLQCYTDPHFPGRERMGVDDWVRIGLRLSSLLVIAASLLAAATSFWWSRWMRHPEAPAWKPPRVAGWSRWILLGTLLLGAALRLPSARCGMTYDEQDNARRNYHGYHELAAPGAPARFVEARWQDAVWENERGNNPFLFSFLSQVSQSVWRQFAGAPRDRFDLVAMRFPSLFFGLAALAAVWWSMNQIGLGRAAPWAGLLMAVHGLALHHSIEARAYGLCLFFSSALIGLAWRVIHRGRGWEWALFGLLVCASILAYPGMFYFVASVNLFVAAVLGWRAFKARDRLARANLARWFVSNSAAALAFFWVFFPTFPQAAGFFATKFPEGNLDLAWAIGAFTTYGSGLMAWFDNNVGAPGWTGPSELAWWGARFPAFWPVGLAAFLIFPLVFLTGLVSAWREEGGKMRAALLATCLLAGAAMFCHHAFLTGFSLYHWYVIYTLPALLGLMGCGLAALGSALARRLGRPDRAPAWTGLVAAFHCLWLLWIVYPWPGARPWQDDMAIMARQPPSGGWRTAPGEIPRIEIQRGESLWVTYLDGYQIRYHDYEDHLAQWRPIVQRPLAGWGRLTQDGTGK